MPEVEARLYQPGLGRCTTFGWGLLKDGDLYENYRRLLTGCLPEAWAERQEGRCRAELEVTAPTYRAAEPVVPGKPWHDLLASVFADATLVDINDFYPEVRAIKTRL